MNTLWSFPQAKQIRQKILSYSRHFLTIQSVKSFSLGYLVESRIETIKDKKASNSGV